MFDLVNLTDDDKVTSQMVPYPYNHSIAEGNSEYYFFFEMISILLTVADGKAVDTGERVGADDVYSH